MESTLSAAVRSTSIARDEAVPGADCRFATIVARQAGTLDAFVAGGLAERDGGPVGADTFLAMSRARLAARGTEAHAAWLFGVCINVARELARTAARRLGDALDPQGRRTPDAADRLRVARRVSARLSTLRNGDLHDALLLVAMDEISIDDAALLPSLPAGTVRSRLARGRRALDGRLHPTLLRAAA